MTDDITVLKRMVERYGAHFRMDDDYYEALALLDGATGLVKAGVSDRLLQHNPEPIKIVPQAVRDVWTKRPGWRCEHEDGRGRCGSRETQGFWLGRSAFYCEKHRPTGG